MKKRIIRSSFLISSLFKVVATYKRQNEQHGGKPIPALGKLDFLIRGMDTLLTPRAHP
jgi:hypothetical protein